MIIREAKIKYKKVGTTDETSLDSPEKAAKVLREFFEAKELDPNKEHFFALLLNRKNKLIGIEVVTIGTATNSLVHPRETFRGAIIAGATAVIVAHNHPSGDTSPSNSDVKVTRTLSEASKIIDIDLLDHIIFSNDSERRYSFSDKGLL